MESNLTLAQTINDLKGKGYTRDFNVGSDRIVCNHSNAEFYPEDFTIDKVYRFGGTANPGDQAVLYAISSDKYDIKGVLVDAIFTGAGTDTIISRLSAH